MSTPQKLSPGDRVVRTSWSAGELGVVVKPSRKTALVRFDGRDKDERVNLESIRLETAEDRAKREHARQMLEWQGAQPPRGVVSIEYDRSSYSTQRVTGFAVRATTPAQMRTAADELRLLADWFEKRPKDVDDVSAEERRSGR